MIKNIGKLRILSTILAVIVVVLSMYGVISGNNKLIAYTMFFLGAMLLTMGIVNIKEEWNLMGIISIIVSIFVLLVSVKGLFFN